MMKHSKTGIASIRNSTLMLVISMAMVGCGGGVVAQPFQQAAAHLLGLRAQLAALAGAQHPGVERVDA